MMTPSQVLFDVTYIPVPSSDLEYKEMKVKRLKI